MANNDPAQTYAQNLVDTLKKKGDLIDSTLEDAFLSVPRHLFLPDVPLEKVYEDEAIAIKRETDGSVLSSSSQPSMMALMLRQLKLRPGDNVLEIGTGTGYNAAIMQHIVGDKGSVTSVEVDKELAYEARIHLQHAGVGNTVTVVDADGAMGYAPRAAYDRVIAAVGIWDVPPAWIKQLKSNGILVAPMWIEGGQVSAAFTLQSDGSLYSARNLPCEFITLRGIAAGPNVYRRVSGSGLILATSEANRIDGASVHALLSDDVEISHLVSPMTADDYWNGFTAYLAIKPPEGYLFTQYVVGENQQAYGLGGTGFAIITQGSACFVPYTGGGIAYSFGGADAFMAMQGALDAWDKQGRPGSAHLRLQVLSKRSAQPVDLKPLSRISYRQYHDLLVWLDV